MDENSIKVVRTCSKIKCLWWHHQRVCNCWL